jgi:6-phosphogluconolactonase
MVERASMPEVVVGEAHDVAELLAARVEAEAAAAQDARSLFSIALPGGSVATQTFPRLAALPLDWARTAFFWGDERAVPPTHRDSNYAVARSLWLDPAGVPEASVHRMRADAPDIEQAADAYADTMVRVLGPLARIDVALLGVGPDGHVCSLFPEHALLAEEGRFVAAVTDSPKPPPRRLTLTLPALAAARLVIVVAQGEAKAEIVRAAVLDPASPLPVARVLRRAQRAVVLLDPPAARLLK